MTNKLDLPVSKIIILYCQDKLSLNALGSKFGTSGDVIKSRLVQAGVELRSKRECYDLLIPPAKILKRYERINKLKNPLSLSTQKKFEILARDGFRCQYCGCTPQDGIKLIVEHIIPKCRGGSNAPSNLITACFGCNVSKGSKLLLAKNKQIPSFMAITTLTAKQEARG